MTEQAICPDCAQSSILVGAIPATDLFAGRRLKEPLDGGGLWRCPSCALAFRFPRLSKARLDVLYAEGNEWNWGSPATTRNDWMLAQDWITSQLPADSSVLDIGCFDGSFIAPLVEHYKCSGIEIHPVARERASFKGVNIIGSDFSVIEGQFDLITAFDVIEHMEQPATFLERCLAALPQGGMVILSTGNVDSATFRLLGSQYWYCTIAEHISFVSPTWSSNVCKILGCKSVFEARFAHSNVGLTQGARQVALNLVYRFAPRLFRIARRMGLGGFNVVNHPQLADHPPSWMGARDHFMIILQKL